MSGENVLTCSVKDLYINCEYFFRVKAINKVGAGQYLELRNPIIIEDLKRRSSSQLQENLLYCFSMPMLVDNCRRMVRTTTPVALRLLVKTIKAGYSYVKCGGHVEHCLYLILTPQRNQTHLSRWRLVTQHLSPSPSPGKLQTMTVAVPSRVILWRRLRRMVTATKG